MNFLKEIMSTNHNHQEYDDLPDDYDQNGEESEYEDLPEDEYEDLPDDYDQNDEGDFSSDEDFGNEDLPDDYDPNDEGEFSEDESGEDSDELDQVASKASEDSDRQGVIRTVPGAQLVYKRETEEGTYEELWMYNTNDSMQDALQIRQTIIAGTDIPVNKIASDDGKQQYSIWTTGNIEMLQIKGLQN
ncbi:MAG: hypothetical protein ACXW2E_00365 [Nitrososphaeraceae archaeon]